MPRRHESGFFVKTYYFFITRDSPSVHTKPVNLPLCKKYPDLYPWIQGELDLF